MSILKLKNGHSLRVDDLTSDVMGRRYFFYNIDEDIMDYIRVCEVAYITDCLMFVSNNG